MICIIWEFEVETAKAMAFEEIYSSHGAWALLFQQSKNYLGTTLLKATEPSRSHGIEGVNHYLTIDQWDSLVDFENFKAQHLEAYNDLDRQCESLTTAERKVGIFANM